MATRWCWLFSDCHWWCCHDAMISAASFLRRFRCCYRHACRHADYAFAIFFCHAAMICWWFLSMLSFATLSLLICRYLRFRWLFMPMIIWLFSPCHAADIDDDADDTFLWSYYWCRIWCRRWYWIRFADIAVTIPIRHCQYADYWFSFFDFVTAALITLFFDAACRFEIWCSCHWYLPRWFFFSDDFSFDAIADFFLMLMPLMAVNECWWCLSLIDYWWSIIIYYLYDDIYWYAFWYIRLIFTLLMILMLIFGWFLLLMMMIFSFFRWYLFSLALPWYARHDAFCCLILMIGLALHYYLLTLIDIDADAADWITIIDDASMPLCWCHLLMIIFDLPLMLLHADDAPILMILLLLMPSAYDAADDIFWWCWYYYWLMPFRCRHFDADIFIFAFDAAVSAYAECALLMMMMIFHYDALMPLILSSDELLPLLPFRHSDYDTS